MARITTPDVPSLWGWDPDPPIIRTRGPGGSGTRPPVRGQPPFQQRPPLGGPLPEVTPNDRHPFTNAPIWNPDLPADAPMPPSSGGEQRPTANARSPITNAVVYFRPGQPIPPGWEI